MSFFRPTLLRAETRALARHAQKNLSDLLALTHLELALRRLTSLATLCHFSLPLCDELLGEQISDVTLAILLPADLTFAIADIHPHAVANALERSCASTRSLRRLTLCGALVCPTLSHGYLQPSLGQP